MADGEPLLDARTTHGLVVQKSRIPRAGHGLFAARAFPRGALGRGACTRSPAAHSWALRPGGAPGRPSPAEDTYALQGAGLSNMTTVTHLRPQGFQK